MRLLPRNMPSFICPRCSATFTRARWWIYHMQYYHERARVLWNSPEPQASQMIGSDPTVSATTPMAAEDIAVTAPHVGPKTMFRVAYEFGRGNKKPPLRTIIPKNESYSKFLQRLHHVYHGDSFDRSLRQWEYVLVNHRYEKGDPLPLTSSSTYYAMVSELLSPRSQWRHAVIRRSVSLQYRAGSDSQANDS